MISACIIFLEASHFYLHIVIVLVWIFLQSEDAALREMAVRLVERVLARAIAEECMNLPGHNHLPEPEPAAADHPEFSLSLIHI